MVKNMPRKGIYYNRTNTCDRCREESREIKLSPGKAKREYNKEENWTGRWLCNKCCNNDFYKYVMKPLANCRTGNQNPDSNQAKGDRFQELTCRWRSTISTVPVEDLNIKNDNYTRGTPIDHSRDSELGIIQTKGSLYNSENGWWSFGCFEGEWEKEFDYEICYCASKDGKTIDRIYIIPKKDIDVKYISIFKYNSIGELYKGGWYEQYRIKDEESIKKVNDIWKEILEISGL